MKLILLVRSQFNEIVFFAASDGPSRKQKLHYFDRQMSDNSKTERVEFYTLPRTSFRTQTGFRALYILFTAIYFEVMNRHAVDMEFFLLKR